ncbi:MAG: hypothetical protein RLZZ471_449 [Actinomycetota bacterium]|jgi:hypothetical protein
MILRVKAIALCLAAVATFAGGSAALADDEDNKGHQSGQNYSPFGPHHPHPEENELHDRYGDVGQVNLPPLVVKGEPKTGAAANGTSDKLTSTSKSAKLKDAGTANPAGNVPVDPTSINPHQGTPADNFFNSATIGLGVMGAGAVALGAVAIRRSIKIRKDPKADFLYQ